MLTSTLTLIGAIVALMLSSSTRKPLTKTVTIVLALSSIIYLDPLIGVGQFGYIAFALASILAAVEPSNSLNLKTKHKSFFVAMGVVMVLIAVSEFLGFDHLVPKYAFGLLYAGVLAFFWFTDKRRLKSRSGILLVWLIQAIKWIFTLPFFN